LFTQQPSTDPCASPGLPVAGCGSKPGDILPINGGGNAASGSPVHVIDGGVRLPDNVVNVNQ
jgi:hypothetical protein